MVARRLSSRPPQRISGQSLRIRDLDYELASAARRVVEQILGVVSGDELLLLVDAEHRSFAETLVEVAASLRSRAEIVELERFGSRPLLKVPKVLEANMQRTQVSVLSAQLFVEEHPFRNRLCELALKFRSRHVQLMGLSRGAMLSGLSVDASRVLDATRALRMRLREDSRLEVRSALGTDLRIELDPEGRATEHAGFVRTGKAESLPLGILEVPPKLVEGILVADASVSSPLGCKNLVGTTVKLELERGHCRRVETSDLPLSRALERFISGTGAPAAVSAVLLGTNVGMAHAHGDVAADMTLPGVHLVMGPRPAEMVLGLGSKEHVILTSALQDVDLDQTPLLRSGRYLIG